MIKKYLDLARKLKKLLHMTVTVTPPVMARFEPFPKGWKKKDWRDWKSEEEFRPSRPQHFYDRPEYREEPLRSEKTCSDSDSSEKNTS